jgi:hypothetical protein
MSRSGHRDGRNVPSRPLPTDRDDLATAVRITVDILRRPRGAAVALLAAASTLVLSTTARNLAVVLDVVLGEGFPLASRVKVAVALFPGVGTPPTVEEVSLVLVALATGVVVTLATYQVRRASGAAEGAGGAGLGVIAATVGGGCASCGSAVLAALFSAGAANGAAVLPFDGLAVLWASIGLLGFSAYRLTAIEADVCEIGERDGGAENGKGNTEPSGK